MALAFGLKLLVLYCKRNTAQFTLWSKRSSWIATHTHTHPQIHELSVFLNRYFIWNLILDETFSVWYIHCTCTRVCVSLICICAKKERKELVCCADFCHGGHGECQLIDKTFSGSCPCACISRKCFLITVYARTCPPYLPAAGYLYSCLFVFKVFSMHI